MRVLLSTTSGAGHFRPLLPIVRALLRAGHELACAAPPEAADMVRREGLQHLPFDGVPPDHAERIAAFSQAPSMTHAEAIHLVGSVVFGRLNTSHALPGAQRAVRDFAPDLVLHEAAEVATRIAAELVGVPSVAVHPALMIRTFPEAIAAGVSELRASLGLDPDESGSSLIDGPGISWFPPSFDLPDAPHQLRRFRDAAIPLPSALEDRSQIYVTLGSEAPGLPFFVPVLQQAVAGAARAGLPVVVATGRQLEPEVLAGIAGDIRPQPWVDQSEVLRRTRVVVCHAGAGTTLAALAAQVPVVAIPLFADQPDNADRLQETGCGIRVAPVADQIAEAVNGLLGEVPDATRRMCREMADLPPAEDAVPWLESQAR